MCCDGSSAAPCVISGSWGRLSAEGSFWRMVAPLIEVMGEAYPELVQKRELVERALKAEEAAFSQTLDAGMQRLDGYLAQGGGTIDGEQLFQLHDTYGCPPDLIADILREKGTELRPSAMADYERLMEQQRERARAAGKFGGGTALPTELIAQLQPTEFLGYEHLEAGGLAVVALLKDGKPVDAIKRGREASCFS